MRPRTVRKSPFMGSFSIVIAAHNEAANIGRKLDNLTALGLPTSRGEVLVVSDGSTDGTNQILASQACPGLRALFQEPRAGKAVALNLGIKEASGDVVVFMDARQTIEPGALENLLANFADPLVGCVSGALMIGQQNLAGTVYGETVKMAFENKIRSWEGQSGSMIGAAGAFYAVRRELAPTIPAGTLLDDMYVPLHALKSGARVVLEEQARAWDDLSPSLSQEYGRKVRTLTGNYQLIQLLPWLLTWSNPVLFEFISHKIFRLLSPFALVLLLLTSILLPGPIPKITLVLQSAFYLLAAIGLIALPGKGIIHKISNLALSFVTLNAAAAMAFVNAMRQKSDVWLR